MPVSNAVNQTVFDASAELFTFNTPLRALHYGVTSNEFSMRGAYRWHEERSLGLVAAYQRCFARVIETCGPER